MGLPAKRRTSTSKRQRASHFSVKRLSVQMDESGNPHLPHRASPATGTYRGKTATNVQKRAGRSLARAKKIGKVA